MTPEQEQGYRVEAERLSTLPREMQKHLISQHRAIAADKQVPKADRNEAKQRADALEKLLQRIARKNRENV